MAGGQKGGKEGLKNWARQITSSPLVQEGEGCQGP